MPDSSDEVAVFIDTNFGTRLAVAVSPHITAGDLKREIERAHTICFPELGSVYLESLMVKKKSFFYCLPDSIPMKHVCHSVGRSWFLHAKGSVLDVSQKVCVPESFTRKRSVKTGCILGTLVGEQDGNRLDQKCCNDSSSEGCDEQQGLQFEGKCDSDHVVETTVEELRDVSSESVSGIIDRYFSNLLEFNELVSPSSPKVASRSIRDHPFVRQANLISHQKSPSIQGTVIGTPMRVLPMPLPIDPGPSLRKTSERTQIGRSFVMASNNLFSSQNKQRPVISHCGARMKKPSLLNSDSCIKSSSFEIGDDDSL